MTLALRDFQAGMAAHLRDPRAQPRPAGAPARRMAVYRELVFNNLESFLLACFPVVHGVLGARRWRSLVRAFLREARCQSPYFRDIPREFHAWLAAHPASRPAWLCDLAHYEWTELAVDTMDADLPPHLPAGDLLAGVPLPTPALIVAAYAWPVQRIGPAWRPRKQRPTHLAIYRDREDAVRFVELQPASARLLALLRDGSLSGAEACAQIAAELGRAQDPAVLAGGAAELNAMRASGILLGTRP